MKASSWLLCAIRDLSYKALLMLPLVINSPYIHHCWTSRPTWLFRHFHKRPNILPVCFLFFSLFTGKKFAHCNNVQMLSGPTKWSWSHPRLFMYVCVYMVICLAAGSTNKTKYLWLQSQASSAQWGHFFFFCTFNTFSCYLFNLFCWRASLDAESRKIHSMNPLLFYSCLFSPFVYFIVCRLIDGHCTAVIR